MLTAALFLVLVLLVVAEVAHRKQVRDLSSAAEKMARAYDAQADILQAKNAYIERLRGAMVDVDVLFEDDAATSDLTFVECVDAEGRSLRAGTWRVRPDGLQALRVRVVPPAPRGAPVAPQAPTGRPRGGEGPL